MLSNVFAKRFRLLSAILCLTLFAAACSSSDSVDSSDAATESIDDIIADTETDAVPDTPAFDPNAEPNPEAAKSLLFSLANHDASAEEVDCLITRSESDEMLRTVLVGLEDPAFTFTEERFTALAVNTHACLETETLAASLVSISGAETGLDEFTACATEAIDDETNGDLAYTGLSAVLVGIGVPTGARDMTIDNLVTCVPSGALVEQLAAGSEQAGNYAIQVDRDCLAESVDEDFARSFYTQIVTQVPGDFDIATPIEACTSEYDSGLPKEIPADFVPWSGTKGLAGIDPSVRNGSYEAAPPMTIDPAKSYQAVITTNDGEIVIDLATDTAPITVNNFVSLANDGYYDGTVFHRVLENFMAQAGDPTGTGTGGPGYTFEDEESGLTPLDQRGVLAMANSGPDTNGSQFFITFVPTEHLSGIHTVFGYVVEGDDVLAQVDLRDPAAPLDRGEMVISIDIRES